MKIEVTLRLELEADEPIAPEQLQEVLADVTQHAASLEDINAAFDELDWRVSRPRLELRAARPASGACF